MPDIRLITFDLDNTLWDVNPVILRAEKVLKEWMGNHIPEVLDHYHLEGFKAFRKQATLERPELAKLPTTFRKALLAHCFGQIGLTGADLDEQVELAFRIFHQARNEIDFYPETIPLLQSLQKDFDLIALSNGNADVHMVGLGDYFKAHFSAESTGKPKPDPAMFLAALEHADVSPEQALHIGDHPVEDIETARQLGFNTIWFNEDQKQSPDSCNPDRTVHQLNQLVSSIQDLLD